MCRFLTFFLLFWVCSSHAAELPLLTRDCRGPEVSLVQKILKRSGFDVEPSGLFDENTEKAVRNFQQQNGQFPHGLVNDSTWVRLLEQRPLESNFIRGIDMSRYQNEVFRGGMFPFEKLHSHELDFCFVKGTHGGEKLDPYFAYNFNCLEEEHMIKGVYHFFSLLKDDIHQQVSNFLSMNIDFSRPGILPPVLDIEEDSRPFDLSYIVSNRAIVVERIRYWLSAVELITGRRPIIYCRKNFWEDVLGNPDGFGHYYLWIANYQPLEKPSVPEQWNGKWHFWQYTDKGSLPGVSRIDFNRFGGSYRDLLSLANIINKQ